MVWINTEDSTVISEPIPIKYNKEIIVKVIVK